MLLLSLLLSLSLTVDIVVVAIVVFVAAVDAVVVVFASNVENDIENQRTSPSHPSKHFIINESGKNNYFSILFYIFEILWLAGWL